MSGYDFHRQKPLLNYIVDFFCHELELAIEIDGISHDEESRFEKDKSRQSEIEELGVTFLRFRDEDVKNDLDNVMKTIQKYIQERREGNK